MAGDGRQRLAQRSDGVLGVARLLPPAGHLEVDRRRPLDPVGADPVRVGVDGRQQLQRLLVARPNSHRLGEALGRGVQLLQLLAQHAPETEQQVGPPPGVGGPLQLQLVEPDHRAEVAERAVDLARRLDRLEMLGRELAGPLRVAHRALELGEVVQEQLPHLRFQLGQAGRLARARDSGRLHLEHRHVVGGPTLLAVDVLEAGGRSDVGRIAIDGVDQMGRGPRPGAAPLDAALGRPVEQLAGLGVILDGLGARLVERHQFVVLLRLAICLAQGNECLGVGRVPLQSGFVFADGGHARGDPETTTRSAEKAKAGRTLAPH